MGHVCAHVIRNESVTVRKLAKEKQEVEGWIVAKLNFSFEPLYVLDTG